jgi:iron complex transport system permease protein
MNLKGKNIIIITSIIYIIIFIMSISIGSVNIGIKDVIKLILNKVFGILDVSNIPDIYSTILFNIRIPRILMASLVGASLSLAGSVMQGLLKNPLADGSSLGVSSGASIGAIIAIGFSITIPIINELSIVAVSTLFAFISLVLVLYIVKKIDINISSNTVILAGIIFSMISNSIVSFLIYIFSNDTKKIIFWTLGSLSSSNMDKVLLIMPIFFICLLYILFKIPELNVFIMGETNAKYIGVNTKKTKIILYILSSILVGISVAMTGNIAFVRSCYTKYSKNVS